MLSLHAASATDAGRVRTSNQDRALVTERLIAVADGMGGHAGGEIAAQLAVEGLAFAFDEHRDRDGLVEAARAANVAVFDRAQHDTALLGMGTTLTAAALVHRHGRDELLLVNVGDSRAYLLEGSRLLQITEDHSLVEQMVRRGEISPAEALVHPHRHILTRAVGIDHDVDVDAFTLEPRGGMRLLLCSDGLTNELSGEEIAGVLAKTKDRAQAARELVARALEHGGSDNITVVVADLDDDREAAPPPQAAAEPALAVRTVHPRAPEPPPVRARRAPPERRPPSPRRRRDAAERIVTGRVVAFVFLLLATFGGIAGFTIWFNRGTYYVGIDDGYVAIYEGRPGGFLWFEPTLVRRTSLPVSDVLDATVPLLRAGVLESSYDAAQDVVNSLTNERSALGLPPPTTVALTPTTLTPTTLAGGRPLGATGTGRT